MECYVLYQKNTAEKMEFSAKDFFSKCDQICKNFDEKILN